MSTRNNKNRIHEDIASRAYTLYEQRGREPGHELEDWLEAEKQLLESESYGDEAGRRGNEEESLREEATWEPATHAETRTTRRSR
jgi:hypothetical protein